MTEPQRPIFRPEAIERYARRRDQPVAPEPVRPPTLLSAALLAGLLALGLGIAWRSRVPELVGGVAISSSWSGRSTTVLLLPPGALPRLAPGQAVVVHGAAALEGRRIDAVEPRVMTEAEIRRRLPAAFPPLPMPPGAPAAAVATLAPPQPEPSAPGPLRAEVEVGSRALLTVLWRAVRGLGR